MNGRANGRVVTGFLGSLALDSASVNRRGVRAAWMDTQQERSSQRKHNGFRPCVNLKAKRRKVEEL